ncbi:uncharacterized protein isoform X1 [Musca autumnalis]|uniref:uncharacterized protein isoform X1 n=1 Tax=Musca autumnalis TaxID=221902 RepID=UPI003CF1B006
MRSRRNSSTRELYQCVICDRSHALRFCPEFVLMRVEDRRKVVRDNDYCMNCLARSHQVRRCHSKVVCKKCGSQHHSMLHPESATTALVRHEDSDEVVRSTVHERLSSPNRQSSSNRRSKRRRHHKPNKTARGQKRPSQQSQPKHRQPSNQHHQAQHHQPKQHKQQRQHQRTNRYSNNRQQGYRQPNRRHQNHPYTRNNSQNHHQTYRQRPAPNTPRTSVLMPDQLVLSQAIKSLAEVMCVSSSVAQVQGRRHGQI